MLQKIYVIERTSIRTKETVLHPYGFVNQDSAKAKMRELVSQGLGNHYKLNTVMVYV